MKKLLFDGCGCEGDCTCGGSGSCDSGNCGGDGNKDNEQDQGQQGGE